jgi:uncharacterized protein (DUF1499 family)
MPFVHVTFSTAILGLIDDMFIQTKGKDWFIAYYSMIDIQSQLRIGTSDYGRNIDHIKALL